MKRWVKFAQILLYLCLTASFGSSWELPRTDVCWWTWGLKSSYSWSKMLSLMTVLPNYTCNLRACVGSFHTRFHATPCFLRLHFSSCNAAALKSNDRKVTFCHPPTSSCGCSSRSLLWSPHILFALMFDCTPVLHFWKFSVFVTRFKNVVFFLLCDSCFSFSCMCNNLLPKSQFYLICFSC